MKKFKFNQYVLYFRIGSYSNNNELSVSCYTEEGLFSNITINLYPTFSNYIDEAFIDPRNKDIGLYQILIDEGIIKEVIQENIPYDTGHYDLVRFNLDKLKEYDPKGYRSYLETIGFEEKIYRVPKM